LRWPEKQLRRPGPHLPHHNLPEPFATLQTLGFEEDVVFYLDLEEDTAEEDIREVVSRLADMALDTTYYSYGDPNNFETEQDPRCYTPLQAVRAMCYFADDALFVVPRMLPLFATDDDNLGEALPELYASIGPDVVETLTLLTLDEFEDIYTREGASSSLVELADMHEEQFDLVRAVIEKALNECRDEELCGYLILNLMDLGSQDSLPVIERAFTEERVDLDVVVLPDVIEHFKADVVVDETSPQAQRIPYAYNDLAEEYDYEEEDEGRMPYVAPEKVGRNDPCPCGSGKKYKKCCGVNTL